MRGRGPAPAGRRPGRLPRLVNAEEAARVLGVSRTAPPEEVRSAYRALIRAHHPDRPDVTSAGRATRIIEAYRILVAASPPQSEPPPGEPPDPGGARAAGPSAVATGAPPVARLGVDALLVDAPADEAFRWLLDAAHDVGEITYVDRSMPILEVLCRFEGEPATSLLVTLQGRGSGTEVFATVESIEARPAPPTAAVVDLLELA
ncbi:MAG: J domain-containing protein, partial [Acidimicrobiales bacterium]|nr:J domain-containing protein [Acidimicrobiales bacterium]